MKMLYTNIKSKQILFFTLFLSSQLLFSCNLIDRTIIVDDTCKSIYDTLTNQIVYISVDKMPEYNGGTKEVLNFFSKNYKYPKQDFFQGSFQLGFIIDIKGNVVGQRIRNKGAEELTEAEKEMLRVLSLMPKWEAGKCKGKIVPVLIYIPLKL